MSKEIVHENNEEMSLFNKGGDLNKRRVQIKAGSTRG